MKGGGGDDSTEQSVQIEDEGGREDYIEQSVQIEDEGERRGGFYRTVSTDRG